MDGLEQQLSQFLSDPNSMKQLQGMISSLGLNNQQSGGSDSQQPAPDHAQGMPDMSALAGMLGALGGYFKQSFQLTVVHIVPVHFGDPPSHMASVHIMQGSQA